MAEDRSFEIFADDLFKYVLANRVEIAHYANQVKRAPKEPASNFHPCIEIPLQIICSNIQHKYTEHFFPENALDVKNCEAISQYYSSYTEVLNSITGECDVFDKLLVLASVTVELGALCFKHKNRLIAHYAPKLYFSAFSYFKKDFFDKGGWIELKKILCEEFMYYGRLKVINDWKGEFSERSLRQLSVLTRTAILFSIKLNNGETRIPFLRLVSAVDNKLEKLEMNCELLIDCPESKICESMSVDLMEIFKMIISQEKDPSYEQLSKIIENKAHVKHLLRYCLFIRVIIGLIGQSIRRNNADILQFVKLLLKDNPRMAYFCIQTIQDIHRLADKKKLSEQSRRNNLPEANSNVTSCEQISEKENSLIPEAHKILLSRFLEEITPKNEPYPELISRMLKILSDEDDAITLLKSEIFRNIMQMRISFNKSHFGDPWMLITTQYLLYCLQPSEASYRPTGIFARTRSCVNETSENYTPTKLTELKQRTDPTIVTETTESFSSSKETVITKIIECNDQNMEVTKSLVCSTSSHESHETGIVEGSDLNVRTLHIPVSSTSCLETGKTEIVEAYDLNVEKETQIPCIMHQCYLCCKCFDGIGKLKVSIQGESIEIFIPIKYAKQELKANKELKFEINTKCKCNITCETSAHGQNSSTTENASATEDLYLLLADLNISDDSNSS